MNDGEPHLPRPEIVGVSNLAANGLPLPPVGPRQSANERIIKGRSLGPQTQYAGTRGPDTGLVG
jgi:hypothetical protein